MIRSRLSYANVMSTLGVFIALGGTSYAVAKLPKGSVGSDQLRSAAVTNAKIAGGAVTADKLAPGAADSGPRGPRGPQGPAGAAGAAGPSNAVLIKAPDANLAAAGGSSLTAATMVLAAGSWNLDGQVRLDYDPGVAQNPAESAWEYVDCDFQDATGARLSRSTVLLGARADGIGAITVPLVFAVTLQGPTRISIICSHVRTTLGPISATNIVMRATRLGSLEER